MARFALLAVLAVGAVATKVTPMEKVISLLTKLEARVTHEGEEEAKAYDKFACFCKDQLVEKSHSIEQLTEEQELEQAHNETSSAAMGTQNSNVDTADTAAETAKTNIKTLTDAMDAKFDKDEGHIKALKRGVDALKKAIEMVRGGRDSTEGQGPLKQNVFAQLPAIVLAQISEEDMKPGHRTSATATSGVLELLRNLLNNFETEYRAAVAAQRDARQRSLREISEEENDLSFANADLEHARAELAEATEQNQNAASSLERITNDLDAEKAFLGDLTSQCETKAADWDQRSHTRNAELTALSKAIKLLKDGAVDNADVTKPGFLAKRQTVSHHDAMVQAETEAETEDDAEVDELVDMESFLQTRQQTRMSMPTQQALAFLRQQARKMGSVALSTLVLKATADPFRAVKNMINKLITDLKDQLADAKLKAQGCETDMKAAQTEIDEQTADLTVANSDDSNAEQNYDDAAARLKQANKDIADNMQAKQEAQAISAKFQKQSKETKAQADEGYKAVTDAIKVLTDFYDGQGFIQVPHVRANRQEGANAAGQTVADMAPDAGGVSGDYHGSQEASNGIIGIMEVLQEDFKTTVDETKAAMDADATSLEKAEKDFNKMIKDAKDAKDTAKTDMSTAKTARLDAQGRIKDANDALEDAKATLATLEKQCVQGESYEVRQQKRENEITSLKQALEILDGADVQLKTKGQD